MTFELADSGNNFITSVINGADLVPTFSAASVDDLSAEVTASAWLNDLRTQIEHTRILRTFYRSATALGSRLPSIASAKVAGGGQILLPVSSGTQTELELWEKLERELYDQSKGEEADVAKEMREEEEAAIAEGRKSPLESNEPESKEAHRFFPAGKIMHIVTIPQVVVESETDDETYPSDADNDDRLVEDKVGIFLTSRSLYSKIRLSHSMIADHFMPVYRRQIENLIRELEKEDVLVKSRSSSEEIEVVL